MVPAAGGAPGTYLSFGKYTHRGWMGAGYLVARQARSRRRELAPRRTIRRSLMTIDPTRPRTSGSEQFADRSTRAAAARARSAASPGRVFGFSLFSFVIFIGYNLQRPGELTARVANPDVTGAPRPVAPLFGDTAWLTKMQLGTISTLLIVVDRDGRLLASLPEAPGAALRARPAPASCGWTRS